MPDPSESKTRQIAIALSHRLGGRQLPRVVASGQGAVAERILDLAFANGVRVREDADLAALLSAAELDAEIPIEAMEAVAEVLAYLYRANGMIRDGAAPVFALEDDA